MISCPVCAAPLDPATIGPEGKALCPACRDGYEMTLFPAMLDPPPRGIAAEHLLGADDAACYYHHGNTAVAACSECGAFVCSLCDIVAGTTHYCPQCFNRKYATGPAGREVTLHDHAALALAAAGLVFIPFMFLGAVYGPIVIAYAVWNWNNVRTPYRHSHWRFGIAIALALGETIASVLFIVAIISSRLA